MAEGIISRRGSAFSTANTLIRTLPVRRTFPVQQGEFVNITAEPTSSSYNSISGTGGATLKSIKLTSTTDVLFFAASTNSSDSYSAVVRTFNFTNLTQSTGTTVSLFTLINAIIPLSNNSFFHNDFVKLNDGRILFYFNGVPGSVGNWRRMFAIINISGTTITVTGAGILNNSFQGETLSAPSALEIINDTKVLVITRANTASFSNRATAFILTISGNTVTEGTAFVLDINSANSAYSVSKIENNRFLVGFTNSSNFPTVAVIVFTEPNILTMGTIFNPLAASLTKSNLKVISVNQNRAVICFTDSSNVRIFRYIINGANLESPISASPFTYTASGDYALDNRALVLDNIRDSLIALQRHSSNGTSNALSTSYVFNLNLTGIRNVTERSFSTSSNFGSSTYSIATTYFEETDNLVISNTEGSSSPLTMVFKTLNHPGYSVRPTTDFTSARGLTKDAAASQQFVDVYVTNFANSNNPFTIT
jgi:hypothetical protein